MRDKNIATIGGGTGSFTLLSGLKKYPVNISAIISMTDDGGSTGLLRDELGVLPPGDIRQCLVALSQSPTIIRKLFNYRFETGSLRGHSFGNLFLSALEKISRDFQEAVDRAGEILKIKGRVIPVTQSDIKLIMRLKSGKTLIGENEINHNFQIQKIGIKEIFLRPRPKPNHKALKAIKEADIIVVGPGNFYCSIIPNLLVKELSRAIQKSQAKVIYICNLVNKKGHNEGYDLDDYAKEIEEHIGKNRIDYVIYNTEKPSPKQIQVYRRHSENLIVFNENKIKNRSYQIIKAKVLARKIFRYSKTDSIAAIRTFIRHDSDRLARVIMFILDLKENKNIIGQII